MHLFSSRAVKKHVLTKKVLALCSCVLGLSGLLSACDSHKSTAQKHTEAVYQEDHVIATSAHVEAIDLHTQNTDDVVGLQSAVDEEVGHKLTEIAGQASLPVEKYQKRQDDVLTKQELGYVGIYRTKIPCEDAFARCEKGQSEYILNLLADGTAHRTVVNLGRIYSDKVQKNRQQFYRQDTWSYDAYNHEIIIHLAEGQNFYYQVVDHHHLMIHLDKNQQQEYEEVMSLDQQYYLQPAKAYILKKAQD